MGKNSTQVNEVVEKLILAGKFSVNPAYSLFSYRDNDWTLVTSGNDANAIASEYIRFAISGQWGDCLELRCDGRRVALQANQLLSDKQLASKANALRQNLSELMKCDPKQLCIETLCTNETEANIWIDKPTSGARICVTFTEINVYRIEVEYPKHIDGEFAICRVADMFQAVEVFQFANAMLDDIRSAIHEII